MYKIYKHILSDGNVEYAVYMRRDSLFKPAEYMPHTSGFMSIDGARACIRELTKTIVSKEEVEDVPLR